MPRGKKKKKISSSDSDSDGYPSSASCQHSNEESNNASQYPTTLLGNNIFSRRPDKKEFKLLYSASKQEKAEQFKPSTCILGVATSRWNDLVAFACGAKEVFIAKIKRNSSAASSEERFKIQCTDKIELDGGFRSVCFVGDSADNQFVLCGSENFGLTLLKVDEHGKLVGEKICDDDASCTESYMNSLRSCQTAEKESNRFLAVTGEDDSRASVVMCDPKEGVKQVQLLKSNSGCYCACFSACGNYVLVAGEGTKACSVYDVSSGKQCKHLRDVKSNAFSSNVNSLAVCRKNELLALGGDKLASIHDFESGEILHTITFENGGGLHAMAFNHGCDVLAIGTWDSNIALIDCSPQARKPKQEEQETKAEAKKVNENGCFPCIVGAKTNGDVRSLAFFQTGNGAIDSLLCLGLIKSDGAVYETGGAERRWQARKFVAYLHFKKQSNSKSKFVALCDRETGVWNVFRTVMSMLG